MGGVTFVTRFTISLKTCFQRIPGRSFSTTPPGPGRGGRRGNKSDEKAELIAAILQYDKGLELKYLSLLPIGQLRIILKEFKYSDMKRSHHRAVSELLSYIPRLYRDDVRQLSLSTVNLLNDNYKFYRNGYFDYKERYENNLQEIIDNYRNND